MFVVCLPLLEDKCHKNGVFCSLTLSTQNSSWPKDEDREKAGQKILESSTDWLLGLAPSIHTLIPDMLF
jgi:hypothetical protein